MHVLPRLETMQKQQSIYRVSGQSTATVS